MKDEQREPFLRVQVLDLSLQPLVSMGQNAFQLQGHLAEKGDGAAVHGSWAPRGREGLVGQGPSPSCGSHPFSPFFSGGAPSTQPPQENSRTWHRVGGIERRDEPQPELGVDLQGPPFAQSCNGKAGVRKGPPQTRQKRASPAPPDPDLPEWSAPGPAAAGLQDPSGSAAGSCPGPATSPSWCRRAAFAGHAGRHLGCQRR